MEKMVIWVKTMLFLLLIKKNYRGEKESEAKGSLGKLNIEYNRNRKQKEIIRSLFWQMLFGGKRKVTIINVPTKDGRVN